MWRHHVTVPFTLRRQNVDVVHVPHHDAPLFNPSKLVVTIHDCVHVLFPHEDASKFQNYCSYLQTKRVVESAKHVLAVSKSTKQDLINIFELPESKISVIHNALDERFAFTHTPEERKHVLERYQLKDPFVLYSGKIRPHKNLHRLIEAFAVLKSELIDDDKYKNLKLIIIGDELSKHQYLRLTVIRSGAQQDVRFFGFVPYPILRVFYQSAALFAFPSLYEGFGLPPLEATYSSLVVVGLTSLSAALQHAFRGHLNLRAALLFAATGIPASFAGSLLSRRIPEKTLLVLFACVMIVATTRLLVQKGIEQVGKFSWRVAAEKVVQTYGLVAAGRRGRIAAAV